MTAERKCERLKHTHKGLRLCGGTLEEWRGTDGHNGHEWFTTCRKCGATS